MDINTVTVIIRRSSPGMKGEGRARGFSVTRVFLKWIIRDRDRDRDHDSVSDAWEPEGSPPIQIPPAECTAGWQATCQAAHSPTVVLTVLEGKGSENFFLSETRVSYYIE
jgi:hypothetical protein